MSVKFYCDLCGKETELALSRFFGDLQLKLMVTKRGSGLPAFLGGTPDDAAICIACAQEALAKWPDKPEQESEDEQLQEGRSH